jgi:hypothetical protein
MTGCQEQLHKGFWGHVYTLQESTDMQNVFSFCKTFLLSDDWGGNMRIGLCGGCAIVAVGGDWNVDLKPKAVNNDLCCTKRHKLQEVCIPDMCQKAPDSGSIRGII